MVTLTDLALAKKTVPEIGIEVQGISADTIAVLLSIAPDLKKVITGREVGADGVAFLLAMSGDILAQIIAAGTGQPGNDEAVKAAKNLPVGTTAAIIQAIVECTFPQGLNRFIEGLTRLMESAGISIGEPTKVQDTKLPAPSNESSKVELKL